MKIKLSAILNTFLCVMLLALATQAQAVATGNPHAAKKDAPTPMGINSAITGTGTTGQIAKWTSPGGIGDSIITEDKFGKVGIGTTTPTSKLTVTGTIETTTGGMKFPDGTVQTTAGIAPDKAVQSLNGLKGNVLLAAGSNITITPNGNTLTIASSSSDPATRAFQRELLVDLPVGQSVVQKEFDPPPGSDGLRFVIEYLSMEAAGFPKNISFCTTVNGAQTCYPFLMSPVGPGNITLDRSLKLYSDGNTKIKIIVGRADANTIDALTIRLSGFTAPLP